jgi:hypothetical protein
MASLEKDFSFTGRLGKITAYRMRGHDKVIVRSRGGASKHQIQTAAAFARTRSLNQEWKGVTQVAEQIRSSLYALRPLADFNTSGPVNGLVKKIQSADETNPPGRRAILLSRYRDVLGSFSFNRKTFFDSVIRQPLPVSLDASSGTVVFELPALQPSMNFFPNSRYIYYRLILAAGAVSDHTVNGKTGEYEPVNARIPGYKAFYSDWVLLSLPQPAANQQIVPSNGVLPGPDMILSCGAGIQYGMPAADGSIQPVPYAGAARILKCF